MDMQYILAINGMNITTAMDMNISKMELTLQSTNFWAVRFGSIITNKYWLQETMLRISACRPIEEKRGNIQLITMGEKCKDYTKRCIPSG
jgi:hypothetical protein